MYRQQFAFPKTPHGCQDQRCMFSYDGSNVALLSGTLAAGAATGRIPLLIDRDADFLLRAIQISPTVLSVGIEDPGGHPLVNPSSPGQYPLEPNALWAQCDGGPIVTLDSDNWGIFCRKASALIAYLSNPTAAPVAFPIITLHGIKRFSGAQCR